MSSQLGSARTQTATTRLQRPAVPAAAFVALVALVNGALNSLLAALGSVLGPSTHLEYAVAVPLGGPSAALVAVLAAALAAMALAWFVRSVVGTDEDGLTPVPAARHLRRYGRGVAVASGGALAAVLGLALFVVPGLVVLVYLPFVFLAVVLDGETVRGAVESSHARIVNRPLPAVTATLVTGLAVVALCLGGAATALLPPTVEFVVGSAATALVVLGGTYLLAGLYRRLPTDPAPTVGRL
jgi:hypothetical protein